MLASQSHGGDSVEIKIDWDQTHQTIVGFGGTMGWIHPNSKHREEVFDLLFKDLGASFLRVQALGGEDGDESTPQKEDGAPYQFKETEKKAAANIKSALERGVKTIMPVTWAPPGWMKSNKQRAGFGEFLPAMTEKYAQLWTAYVQAMKRDFDIDIHYISIQNEPELTYTYPTCLFSAEHYTTVMKAVRAKLEEANLATQVAGPDVCRIYHLDSFLEQIEKQHASPGTPILTHLYDLSIPYEQVEKDAERWRTAHQLAEKYKRSLWLMEVSNVFSFTVPGSYEEAFIWAQKMHWALVEGDCAVVCFWQLFFDKKGEALIYCEKSEAETYEVTPKFYTSRNFFKFVRPGMERVTASSSDKEVLVSAFRTAAGERVIVVINGARNASTLSVAESEGSWKVYTTDIIRKCVPGDELRDLKEVKVPARSVTTFVKPQQ
jgi:O-glycosyl hydrolase